MARGLSVARIVNVSVSLAAIAAATRNFGAGCIAGDSDVIDVSERIRSYNSADAVAAEFGSTAPETLAAQLHFAQVPQPSILYLSRWASSATKARLNCAILTPAQQLLSAFTPITDGGFLIYIDGVPHNIAGLNFSAQTNLNGVASQIQTALNSASAGSTCVWDAINSRFLIRSGTTGATSSLSYGAAPTAIGDIVFAGQPAANDTVTLNGTVVTFKASGATGNQVNIGADDVATAAALVAFANASADVNISKISWSAPGAGLTVYGVAKVAGAAGDAYTLAESGLETSVSGANLTGGATTASVTTLLGLTSAAGAAVPVPGVAAETAPQCAINLVDISARWYSLQFAATAAIADADYTAIAEFIESCNPKRVFGVSSQNTAVLDPAQTNDLCSQLKLLTLKRTYFQYSSSSPYAAASFFGRAATVDFEGQNTTITLMFKQEPGVAAENLPASQADALKAKGANVFVQYDNDTSILEYGTMVAGYFFDEIQGVDWLENAIQTDVYNLLLQAGKVPQTDAGSIQIANTMDHTMQRAINNGLVAPGQWNGPNVGTLKNGDFLDKGYVILYPPYRTQSQADREARKSVPFQICLKLAGAVHEADVLLNVNR